MTNTSVAEAGVNNTWNRPSQKKPRNRKHVLRYPRFAEPENWLQRFYAVGCHKVIGVGAEVPGLQGGTGDALGRITLENKNTNRNPWDKAINSSARGVAFAGQYVWTAGRPGSDNFIDHDRPTPCSQDSSEVTSESAGNGNEFQYLLNAPSVSQQHDKIGYMPNPDVDIIRPAIGWEDGDEADGAVPNTPTTRARGHRTHGKFTVSGIRTVFLFDPDIDIEPLSIGYGAVGHCMRIEKNSGLHRLDNIIFRPTHDSKIANGDDWGFENSSSGNRTKLGGLSVWEGSTIYNFGPNVAFTDFTNEAVLLAGGTIKGSGVCFSSSDGGYALNEEGKLLLNNATITNCNQNISTRNSMVRLTRSIMLGHNNFVNERNSDAQVVDSAILYGEQYNTDEYSTLPFLHNRRNSSLVLRRNLLHRNGTIYNEENASFESNHNTFQEAWMISVMNWKGASWSSEFDAFTKGGSLSHHTFDQGYSHITRTLVNGMGMQNNLLGDGIACSHGMLRLTGPCLIYNTYNHYVLVTYYGGITDAQHCALWIWGVYNSSGNLGQDGANGIIANMSSILMNGPNPTWLQNTIHASTAITNNYVSGVALPQYDIDTLNAWSGGEAYDGYHPELDPGID